MLAHSRSSVTSVGGQVTLVDPAYNPTSPRALAAAEQLAAFFAPAAVVAFETVAALAASAARDPGQYGRQTTFVQCDASGVDEAKVRELAAACLVDRGLAFCLTNLGRGSSDTRAWWCMGARGGAKAMLNSLDTADCCRLCAPRPI